MREDQWMDANEAVGGKEVGRIGWKEGRSGLVGKWDLVVASIAASYPVASPGQLNIGLLHFPLVK